MPAIFNKLAQIGIDALNSPIPSWDAKQVRQYLRSQLANRQDVAPGEAWRILAEVFRVERVPNQPLNVNLPPEFGGKASFNLTGHVSQMRGLEVCSLLAALDISFSEATAGFINCKNSHVDARRQRVFIGGTAPIESIRSALLHKVSLHPRLPVSRHRRLYWILRLRDEKWLLATFTRITHSPIPSVMEDRLAIEERLHNLSQLRTCWLALYVQLAAYIRADLRDSTWLEDRVLKHKIGRLEKQAFLAKELTEQRAASLLSALEKLLAEEDRPTRVDSKRLGNLVGLSHSQAQATIRANPELRAAIQHANDGKIRRQLEWASKRVLAEGLQLRPKAICKLAGLPMDATTVPIVHELVRRAGNYAPTI